MKVFIVGSHGTCLYAAMYLNDGWEIAESVEEADLVQFTGGEDVSPDLYGCGKHPTTMNNPERDAHEEEIYNYCHGHNKPMVGICRGGQFLNVMCGGRMYQNINNHAIAGTHETRDTNTGYKCQTTSTHHQMMIPEPENGVVIGSVTPSMCDFKDYVDRDGTVFTVEPEEDDFDVEVVSYPYHNVLCFQPHPEYDAGEACREWFFSLVMWKLFNDTTRYNKLMHGEGANRLVYDPFEEEDFEEEGFEEEEGEEGF